jgi:DNA-binding NtrC family response regulator
MVLATGNVIRAEHIPLRARDEPPSADARNLEDVERDHIARVYATTGSHKSRTAEILGVSRPRLDRLLRKHGIE